MKTLLLLLTLSCLTAFAEERPSLERYFKLLDYMKPELRGEALNYEAEFIRYLQKTISHDPATLTKEDAKAILYGTLFLTNTNQGYRFKQVSLSELTQGSGLDMVAREELIIANLKLAQKLVPEDTRIEAWIGSHELYQDEITTGKVSDKKFDRMFALARQSMFAYTALSIIGAELALSPEQEAKMLELADLISDKKIPCVKLASGKCYDHKLAPQTNEVGKLITGDIYLRQANKFVEGKTDPEGLRIKSGVSARVIYGLVDQMKFPNLKRLHWDHIYTKIRRTAVNKLLWREQAIPKETFESMEYKRAYTCIACHEGGKLK